MLENQFNQKGNWFSELRVQKDRIELEPGAQMLL